MCEWMARFFTWFAAQPLLSCFTTADYLRGKRTIASITSIASDRV
jgi:hypothetical protein